LTQSRTSHTKGVNEAVGMEARTSFPDDSTSAGERLGASTTTEESIYEEAEATTSALEEVRVRATTVAHSIDTDIHHTHHCLSGSS
jgi:hypothetical protein